MAILFISSFSPHVAIFSACVLAITVMSRQAKDNEDISMVKKEKLEKTNHTHRHIRQGHTNALAHSASAHPPDVFSLNCPHVTDANNNEVKIEVTWTKDDTIWLKIENGEKKIYNKLTSFDKKRIGNKTVLRVTLNKGRYIFGYDELTGDFAMEIRPVSEEDAGLWQCHVTVYQKGDIHTLTSRSRVKSANYPAKTSSVDANGYRTWNGNKLSAPQTAQLDQNGGPISSFIRPDQSVIEINRDTNEKRVIIFARPPSSEKDGHPNLALNSRMAIVEYEDDDKDYSLNGRGSRKRHRASPDMATTTTTTHHLMLIITIYFAFHRQINL